MTYFTANLKPTEEEIRAEQTRQYGKFGPQNHPDGTGPDGVWAYMGPASYVVECAKQTCAHLAEEGHITWRDILLEEVAEAFAEFDPAKLREELVQVAAVAVTWIEAIDRRPQTEPEETPVYPAPGSEIPGQPGYVVGKCGHRVAGSEWQAGFRTCERCPSDGDQS